MADDIERARLQRLLEARKGKTGYGANVRAIEAAIAALDAKSGKNKP